MSLTSRSGEGVGAMAAVLGDPLQPDQRAPGRALEAAAGLERPAGHRRGRPDRLRDLADEQKAALDEFLAEERA